MRLLVTGLNGTLAPHVAACARARGWQVEGWDRRAVDPDDADASRRSLQALRPDAIVHLALGSEAWAARLAEHAAGAIPMVFVSTAMVFHHEPDGPHRPDDATTAQDDYGRYKIRCETRVRECNPGATLARIGWQIDAHAHGNNMLAHLDQWQARDGRVRASRRWQPACSFMDDTARALMTLVERPEPGVVHLDSNAAEGATFDHIAAALQARFARHDWKIEVVDDYRHDQRLLGGESRMPRLSTRWL